MAAGGGVSGLSTRPVIALLALMTGSVPVVALPNIGSSWNNFWDGASRRMKLCITKTAFARIIV